MIKCIILAAGYATRLYPLTENYPKTLLKVKGKSIIDWLLCDLNTIEIIDEVIVISNHKYYKQFKNWNNNHKGIYKNLKIKIVDDGSNNNNNRLGAVKDILFGIDSCDLKEKMNDQDALLILAGDNLLDFSLKRFVRYYNDKKETCIMKYYEDSIDKLKRTGVVVTDSKGQVIDMQEKPVNPKSNWAVPPFYIFSKKCINLIEQSIGDKNINLDSPGGLIEWYMKKYVVYAYEMPGKRYDIGNIESLNQVRGEYNGIINIK